MTTGTKIFLAVFAAFVGVLVLYYGVLMPEAQPSSTLNEVTRDVSVVGGSGEAMAQATPVDSSGTELTLSLPDGFVVHPAPQAVDMPVLTLESPSSPAQPKKESTTSQAPVAVVTNTITARETPTSPVAANQPATLGDARSSSAANATEYIVKSGDTLSSIAQSWFGDANKWGLIANANPGLDPARLQIGQKLRMPAKNAQPVAVKTQVAGDQTYTVRPGDTLTKIARELYNDGSRWKAIYEANKGVIGSDPAELKPGMTLKLPR